MARLLAEEAHRRSEKVPTYPLSEIPAELEGTFWVVPPEAVREFVRPAWVLLPVEGTKTIGFRKPRIGTIVIPEQTAAASLELFERWEAIADLDFKMWVDFEAITCLNITGLEYQALVT
jgi:hypothetical protein